MAGLLVDQAFAHGLGVQYAPRLYVSCLLSASNYVNTFASQSVPITIYSIVLINVSLQHHFVTVALKKLRPVQFFLCIHTLKDVLILTKA